MNIDIRTRGFSLTPGLRAYIERRLEFALDRYQDRIARVRVVVGDLNGPRGGEDKSCRLEVRIRGGGTVRATAVDGDAYVAIGATAHRAGRGVARALQRERATMLELLARADDLADALRGVSGRATLPLPRERAEREEERQDHLRASGEAVSEIPELSRCRSDVRPGRPNSPGARSPTMAARCPIARRETRA